MQHFSLSRRHSIAPGCNGWLPEKVTTYVVSCITIAQRPGDESPISVSSMSRWGERKGRGELRYDRSRWCLPLSFVRRGLAEVRRLQARGLMSDEGVLTEMQAKRKQFFVQAMGVI